MSTPLQSWVEGANEPHGFGLNHLPYGAFRTEGGGARLCVRLGGFLLDLAACAKEGPFDTLSDELRSACSQSTLNELLALGTQNWQALRMHLQALLNDNAPGTTRTNVARSLHAISDVRLVLPLAVGGYTDFYASVHHARRVGELFRPDSPLLPNYKHVPIAYHGRVSSIVISRTEVRRPWGQQRPGAPEGPPAFAASSALDYELELAFIVGPGNTLGDPWITPLPALEPFRVPALTRPAGDPQPLPYLFDPFDQQAGALDIHVSASLSTTASRAAGALPMPLGETNVRELYWTPAQMFAHHTSNGCNLQPGDLLATGTLSGPERRQAGCLLELTQGGKQPLTLSNGEQRAYLLDGDEVILSAFCERAGVPRILLAECAGRVLSAHPPR